MTNEQKAMVYELRSQGLSYRKIASATGVNLETVKSHCRRQRVGSNAAIDSAEMEVIPVAKDRCKNCGAEIWQMPKRKKKLFCCDKCRNQWWNKHLDSVNRKAYYKMVCQNCGKTFIMYGDSRRKYCCHECYIEERFR